MTDTTERLTELVTQLCAMPCATGEEGPIADWLADRYATAGDVVMRNGHSVVAAPVEAAGDDRPTVLLVGHVDVVAPTPPDLEPRLEGERLVGRGTSDMKSGLAVAMDVFEDETLRGGAYRMVLVAYAGEEGPHEGNELRQVLRAAPGLADAAVAVVLEPTDLEVQLGCLGAVNAEVTISGRQAHSARPWHGDNALTKAGEWLASWRDRAPVDVEVDELVYREVANPTQAWTRNGRNVIPGEFVVNVNYRYAPDKTPAEAEAVLAEQVRDLGGVAVADIVVTDLAPACPPSRSDPLVEAFVKAAGATVAPKQAWTDVARFAEVGVSALNYGPGLTAQAHQRGEYVPVANLALARDALTRFLSSRQ